MAQIQPFQVDDGYSTFTNLTDVPGDYTGESGNAVVVKATEDGLEFGAAAAQKENVPVLGSGSVNGYLYEYVPPPGAASELRITLSDGTNYVADSPIQMDIDSYGLGGKEPDAYLTDATWYYNYGVPDPDNAGYFGIVASKQHPGNGPDGYGIWRYLGALYYIDGADKLRKTSQHKNEFDFPDATETAMYIYYGTGTTPTDENWYSFVTGTAPGGGAQRSLANAIPVIVAAKVDISASIDSDTGDYAALYIESGEVQYTRTAIQPYAESFISIEPSERYINRHFFPLYNNDLYYLWYLSSGGYDWQVIVRGYTDGYLDY